MEVLSPVGTFPLRMTSVKVKEGRLRIATELGVWRSEVVLGREDLPLLGACAGGLSALFLLGRTSARRR
jgi:hypothetical protein